MLVSTVPICMSVYLSVCPFVYLSLVHLYRFIQFLSVIHFLSFWSIANSNLSNSVAMALLSPGTVWNKNRWKKREKRKEGKRERERKKEGRKERERKKGRKEREREKRFLLYLISECSYLGNTIKTKQKKLHSFYSVLQVNYCFFVFQFSLLNKKSFCLG